MASTPKNPELTTEDGLRAYLSTTKPSKEISVTLLSGGTANYVYRVSVDGSTNIFKHAAPYLHSNRNFPFDPIRMDYEAHILQILSPTSGSGPLEKLLPYSAVHAVRVTDYDKANKLLCIGDGGTQNLKAAYEDPNLDIARVGDELAKWVAALHMCSSGISLALPEQTGSSNNNPVAVGIYRHSYKNLNRALSQYGHDTQLAHRVDEEFGSLLETEDECVCHGDFWPGNVLVRLGGSGEKPFELTIVDWEMVRRGNSATDVGQFAAEAFLLDRFKGGRGLLAVFLKTYLLARNSDTGSNSKPGKTWLKRFVVQWAVHIAFWPTGVVWTDKEGTQRLVDLGVGVMKAVLDDNWDKVFASPLLQEVKDEYALLLSRP